MNQSPPPLPGAAPPSTLTPEQRDRIARHKAQAIARRSARLAHQSALAGNVEAMDWQPSPVDPASSSIDQAHPGARIDPGTNILDHRGFDSSSPSLIVDQAMAGQNIFDPRSVDQARIDPGRDIFDSRSIDQVDPGQNRIDPVAVDGDDKTANKPFRLSVEQIRVLEAVADGKSVFVTGSAGTGKSFILEYAIKALRLLHGGSAVFVTASTGIAACAIGGTTLHSFAGIGLGEKEVGDLVSGAMRSKESKSRWRGARALVIDEISMIDGELLDKIDQVGRAVVGRSDRPFGGLQLLVTGDFFQLPPVQKGGGRAKIFAFQAECWRDCFDLQMELKHVFRQSDRNFVAMLDEIRRGQCSDRTIEALQACGGGGGGGGEMAAAATKLFPVLSMVDRVNHEKLAALTGEKVTFFARDVGNASLLRDCRAETEITLAAGAEVMLVKNIDTVRGLVNGARGVLIEFLDPRASRRDLDCYCMEEQEIDESVRSFEEHRRGGGDPAAMGRRSGGRVIEERGEQRRWPVVEFRIGGRLRRVFVNRQNWSVMEGDREVATRNQIPLVLAWALSIHKCQGMTLDRVETDLTRSFGCGMVYVALSRARSLEGIRLRGFNPLLIKVDPNVLGFYNQLERQRQ